MRFVTFLALIVRRVWAKKGILFGSVLGATLVIALLVVVPLYEASVQAVDVKFSIDNALSEEVEATAFSTQQDYDRFVGKANRDVVADSRQTWLEPWYPTSEERSQTREFFMIPSGPDAAVDFIVDGDTWKQKAEEFLAGGGDPTELSPPPYPVPAPEATQVRIFTSLDLEDRLTVLEGEYSDNVDVANDVFEPIPIMIGQRVAALTGAGLGDTFFLKPFSGVPFDVRMGRGCCGRDGEGTELQA